MASVGQKFKKYKPELKVQILREYKETDTSIQTLSRKYKISIGTLSGWIWKDKKNINICKDNRVNSGRKAYTKSDLKEQLEILKKFQVFLEAQNDKK